MALVGVRLTAQLGDGFRALAWCLIDDPRLKNRLAIVNVVTPCVLIHRGAFLPVPSSLMDVDGTMLDTRLVGRPMGQPLGQSPATEQ